MISCNWFDRNTQCLKNFKGLFIYSQHAKKLNALQIAQKVTNERFVVSLIGESFWLCVCVCVCLCVCVSVCVCAYMCVGFSLLFFNVGSQHYCRVVLVGPCAWLCCWHLHIVSIRTLRSLCHSYQCLWVDSMFRSRTTLWHIILTSREIWYTDHLGLSAFTAFQFGIITIFLCAEILSVSR